MNKKHNKDTLKLICLLWNTLHLNLDSFSSEICTFMLLDMLKMQVDMKLYRYLKNASSHETVWFPDKNMKLLNSDLVFSK